MPKSKEPILEQVKEQVDVIPGFIPQVQHTEATVQEILEDSGQSEAHTILNTTGDQVIGLHAGESYHLLPGYNVIEPKGGSGATAKQVAEHIFNQLGQVAGIFYRVIKKI